MAKKWTHFCNEISFHLFLNNKKKKSGPTWERALQAFEDMVAMMSLASGVTSRPSRPACAAWPFVSDLLEIHHFPEENPECSGSALLAIPENPGSAQDDNLVRSLARKSGAQQVNRVL